MKMLHKRLIEVAVLGLMLLVITAPVTKRVWSQFKPQGTIVQGVTPSLGVVPMSVDASGVVQTNITSTSAQPVTWNAASAVSVTNAGTSLLIAANTSRKGLIIQNESTLYYICFGTNSPVSCTTSLQLAPGANMTLTQAVPSNAWYGIGTSSVAATVVSKDAQ